jgi:hypothetical protein
MAPGNSYKQGSGQQNPATFLSHFVLCLFWPQMQCSCISTCNNQVWCLWDGFVAHQNFITGLNKILYQIFSKYSKLLRTTQNTIWQ